MPNSVSELIHARRRLLQNPYAFMEELEELESIRQARKKSENPYAHIEIAQSEAPISRFDGIAQRGRVRANRRYSFAEIETAVRELQRSMWDSRFTLLPNVSAIQPIDLLSPALALNHLGFTYQVVDALGQFSDGGKLIEVAGQINKENRTVQISSQFGRSVRSFTAAHELGHAVLHAADGLHRDRPLSGVSGRRERVEYEADKFAALFLMPKKLVTAIFERSFGHAPFILDENTEFALYGSSGTRRSISLRSLSMTLASTTRFNGVNVTPLADQFGVSVQTMAIRLEELSLVAGN